MASWDSAAWLWPRVRAVFPDAAANLLMPNHTHTLAPCDELRLAGFRRVLQHHSRQFGAGWDVAPPQAVLSRSIACRTARYILLNPVRAGFVRDPLSWRSLETSARPGRWSSRPPAAYRDGRSPLYTDAPTRALCPGLAAV